MNYARFLNASATRRVPSILREMNKAREVAPSDVVFLVEGLPNPETFPFKEALVTTHDGLQVKLQGKVMQDALQYIATPGMSKLISQLRNLQVNVHNPPLWGQRDVLVTTGSQNGLSMAIEMVMMCGDAIVIPDPVYLGVPITTNVYDPHYLMVKEDKNGMRPDTLQEVLVEWSKSGKPKPKLLYVSPTGGNPTGTCMPLDRKKDIYSIASEYDLLILEDDPYYYIHFDGELTPSFLSLDVDGRVIRFDSFSKILSSGLRLGFTTAPREIARVMELRMQSAILHTSAMSQALASELLSQWGFRGFMNHIGKIQQFYKKRRDNALEAAEKHLTGLAEWNVPSGGMFLWMKVNGVHDTTKMIMEKGPKKKVMLAPGCAFQPHQASPSPYLRASYSFATVEEIDIGFSRLAELIIEEQQHYCRQSTAIA